MGSKKWWRGTVITTSSVFWMCRASSPFLSAKSRPLRSVELKTLFFNLWRMTRSLGGSTL